MLCTCDHPIYPSKFPTVVNGNVLDTKDIKSSFSLNRRRYAIVEISKKMNLICNLCNKTIMEMDVQS